MSTFYFLLLIPAFFVTSIKESDVEVTHYRIEKLLAVYDMGLITGILEEQDDYLGKKLTISEETISIGLLEYEVKYITEFDDSAEYLPDDIDRGRLQACDAALMDFMEKARAARMGRSIHFKTNNGPNVLSIVVVDGEFALLGIGYYIFLIKGVK